MIPRVSIGEIVVEVSRPVSLEPGVPYRSVGVKWYGAGVHVYETREGHLFDADRFRIEQDDLIYNDMWARMGSVAIVPPDLAGSVASSHFPTFHLDKTKAFPSYLAWYFRTPSFWNDCENASRGSTGRNQIKRSTFSAIQVPLPPLNEQRRIVARIEELSAKSAEAQRLRQMIASETTRLHSAAISRLVAAHTCKHIRVSEILDDSSLRNGKSIKSVPAETGLRCLTVGALRDGRVDVLKSKPIPMTADEAHPYLIAKGDIFIVRGNGSKELCGRAGIVMEEVKETIFPDLFIKVSLPLDIIDPSFFVSVWNGPELRSWIEEESKTTSGIWKINQGHILAPRIPFPSIGEQRRIVAELDALESKLDSVKAIQAETATELDAMLPAILDKAFKGEL